jgi:hypothetical protein
LKQENEMQDMTALVKKYEDEETFPRMIGTSGGMDYLIIAKDPVNGVQIGIKPLVAVGSVEGNNALIFGFRLRAAYIPDAEPTDNVVTLQPSDGAAPKADDTEKLQPQVVYPFEWENIGHTGTGYRASLNRSVAFNRTPEDAEWAFQDMDHTRFFGKLAALLHSNIPDAQWVVTDEDVKGYMTASYYPFVLMLEAASNPQKALELLDLRWETKVKDHAAHQEQYEKMRAELVEKIAAVAKGDEPTYHPKAHYADADFQPMDGTIQGMLKGAKPKMAVVESVQQGGDFANAATEGGDDEDAADDGSDDVSIGSTDEESEVPLA